MIKGGHKIIGYTIQNGDWYWFYAPVKKTESPLIPLQPADPILEVKQFYTSNDKEIQVVMKDENTVDFENTKKLLEPEIPRIDPTIMEGKTPLKTIAENFAKYGTEKDVEIKEVEGVKGLKLLFVNLKFTNEKNEVINTSTKVFFSQPGSIFTGAFKDGTKIEDHILWDESNIEAPEWAKNELSRENILFYNPVTKEGNLIGYTLKTKKNHWFYAPKKSFETTNFFGSG